MDPSKPARLVIHGTTLDGRTFRPSDWAERLAGVMSQFRPGGTHGGRLYGYSPWCLPTVQDGVSCVIVSGELRGHDVLAWDFVTNFARDNNLKVETS